MNRGKGRRKEEREDRLVCRKMEPGDTKREEREGRIS